MDDLKKLLTNEQVPVEIVEQIITRLEDKNIQLEDFNKFVENLLRPNLSSESKQIVMAIDSWIKSTKCDIDEFKVEQREQTNSLNQSGQNLSSSNDEKESETANQNDRGLTTQKRIIAHDCPKTSGFKRAHESESNSEEQISSEKELAKLKFTYAKRIGNYKKLIDDLDKQKADLDKQKVDLDKRKADLENRKAENENEKKVALCREKRKQIDLMKKALQKKLTKKPKKKEKLSYSGGLVAFFKLRYKRARN